MNCELKNWCKIFNMVLTILVAILYMRFSRLPTLCEENLRDLFVLWSSLISFRISDVYKNIHATRMTLGHHYQSLWLLFVFLFDIWMWFIPHVHYTSLIIDSIKFLFRILNLNRRASFLVSVSHRRFGLIPSYHSTKF